MRWNCGAEAGFAQSRVSVLKGGGWELSSPSLKPTAQRINLENSPSLAWCPAGEHPHTPGMLPGFLPSGRKGQSWTGERGAPPKHGPVVPHPAPAQAHMAERDSSPCSARADPEPFPSSLHCKERGGHTALHRLGAAVGLLATPQCWWPLGPSSLWATIPFGGHITHPHQELGWFFWGAQIGF